VIYDILLKMDTLETIRLLAFVLQFIGIMVGAGLVFERVIKAPPLRALFILLNAVRQMLSVRSLPEYPVSDDIDELYQQASRRTFCLLPASVVTIGLVFSLGLWLLLFFRLYQLVIYDIYICPWFWVGFSVWFIALTINNLLVVQGQLLLERAATSKTSSFVGRFLKNWYAFPWESIKVEVILIVVVILLLPAWVFKIEVNSAKQRQQYYLTYATVTLLISTLIHIILIVI